MAAPECRVAAEACAAAAEACASAADEAEAAKACAAAVKSCAAAVTAAAEALARAAEKAEKTRAEEQELINWAREKQRKKREREERLAAEQREREEQLAAKKRRQEEQKLRQEAEYRRQEARKVFANGVFSYLKNVNKHWVSADVFTPMVGFVYIVSSSDSDSFTDASPPGQELCTGLACLVHLDGTSVTALSCCCALEQAGGDEGATSATTAKAMLVHYPHMQLLFQAEAEVTREFGVALLRPTTKPTTQVPTCFKCDLSFGLTSKPAWSFVFGRKPGPKDEDEDEDKDEDWAMKHPPVITQDSRNGLRALHVTNWEAADKSGRDHFFLCWDMSIRERDAVGSPVWGSNGVCIGIVVAVHKLPTTYRADAIQPFTSVTGQPFKYRSIKGLEMMLTQRDLSALDGFQLSAAFTPSRTLVEVVSFQQLPFFRCPEKEWMDAHPVSNFMLDQPTWS